MRNLFLLVSRVALLLAMSYCTTKENSSGGALDKYYNITTKQNDLQAIGAEGELSEKQLLALSRYLGIAGVSNVNLPLTGRTYRQLAKDAEHFNSKQYALPDDSLNSPPPFVKPQ